MSRYIDADKLNIDFYDEYETEDDVYTYRYVSEYQIDTAPSIDIVRCKECRFYLADEGKCTRTIWVYDWHRPKTKADDYCSYAERKE